MKERLATLRRLGELRAARVRQALARVNYQQRLCQRYRANIEGLARLCVAAPSLETGLQRDNQQRYKSALFKMMDLQRRELAAAEQTLARIRRELEGLMRAEKVVDHVLETRLADWQCQLAAQEQKLQDALAAQSWWRNNGG